MFYLAPTERCRTKAYGNVRHHSLYNRNFPDNSALVLASGAWYWRSRLGFCNTCEYIPFSDMWHPRIFLSDIDVPGHCNNDNGSWGVDIPSLGWHFRVGRKAVMDTIETIVVVFIVQKFFGVIHWSWWWIFSPLLIKLFFGIFFVIYETWAYNHDDRERYSKYENMRRTYNRIINRDDDM
jgi:hypothetical protein